MTQTASARGLRQLARAAVTVMVMFVLSRIAGLAREIVISARFGTSAELDAYLAAFRLPDLLFQLVAGGALGSAFIPAFTERLVQADHRSAWRMASSVVNWVFVLMTLLALLIAALAQPLIAHVVAPGFPPEQQRLTATLMRWMLIATVVFGVSGIVMGILNACQHFLLPALAPVVYNLAIIAGAWFLAPRWGAHGLVIGAVAGAFGHLLVQLPGLWRQGALYIPTLSARDPAVREVGKLMAPRVLGLAAVQVNFLVNTILASQLPAGSLAALNYAWLLMLLPQGVIAQAVATAAFPTFATQVAHRAHEEMRATLNAILRVILLLTAPASVGLIVLRMPLVRLLLERGAFDTDSTAAVTYALAFYAAGLVSHSVVEVVSRAFYALHDTWTPVWVGLTAMTLNVALSLLLVHPLGHGGLALANTLATTIEMLGLLELMRRRLRGLGAWTLVQSAIRAGVAALLMGTLVWIWQRGWGNGSAWWASLSGILVGMITYVGALWALSRGEARALWRVMRRSS
ncbi:MAG: murein biosynthesis integral membrane protein MurJ [Anaerolineae bacterium]|nr:murein biosynthesis integral membrane protein MurJ [Anaerolineae bacterium]MDW8098644.1 murein biosynthesis integral membrane protein MurJ [Anaerolineae bacterium]